MQFDVETLSASELYELLLGTVAPRPIALATTLSPDGALNAAPYSLSNVMGNDPPIVMLSVPPHADQRLKDTAANILATREFVISLVPEALAKAMNVTCIDAPSGVDEAGLAELAMTGSMKVKPLRLADSPVALECRFAGSLSFGADQAVTVGQVLEAYVADRFVIDRQRCIVDTPALGLFGALHGARCYARTSDLFATDRPTWALWKEQGKV